MKCLPIAAACTALLALTACSGRVSIEAESSAPPPRQEQQSPDNSGGDATEQDIPQEPEYEDEEPAAEPEPEAETYEMPDYTGMNLQTAQDTAQADGFWNLTSEDAWDEGRAQVWDRNWYVCSHAPAPGDPADPDELIIFVTAKNDEDCP